VRLEVRDHSAHLVGGRVGGPSRLAGDLTWTDGHERALIGPDVADKGQQIGPRISLDVELDPRPVRREHRRQIANVGKSDVPGVGSRVHRDAVRAGRNADFGGGHDGRHRPAA
jgi:hypothetical protein